MARKSKEKRTYVGSTQQEHRVEQVVVLKLCCPSKLLAELLKILKSRPHPRSMNLESLRVASRSQYVYKILQVIPMSSQG